MPWYNVNTISSYEGRKCGYISAWLKIKGFTFVLKNNMFLGQPFYFGATDSENSPVVTERSFYMKSQRRDFSKPEIPFIDSIHDLTSTDIDYINEVRKLKTTFSTNPNATFKAYRINGNINIGTLTHPEYFPYQSFSFDFEDIFLTDEIHTFTSSYWNASSYPDNTANHWFDRYFVELGNLNFDFQTNIIEGDHYRSANASNFSDYLGTPIGDDLVVTARSSAFLVDDIVYVFKIDNFPLFNSPKTAVAFSWNVYKIPIKRLCCLAQCFGITE